ISSALDLSKIVSCSLTYSRSAPTFFLTKMKQKYRFQMSHSDEPEQLGNHSRWIRKENLIKIAAVAIVAIVTILCIVIVVLLLAASDPVENIQNVTTTLKGRYHGLKLRIDQDEADSETL